MSDPIKLSPVLARRIAIAAQGLDKQRPTRATRAHVERVIARLGVLQIDAVNVVARAHYMPLLSRLGAYDVSALDAAWLGKKRSCFEYWGHEASILPYDAHHLFRWRMQRVANGEGRKHWTAYQKADRGFLDSVVDELRERGPLSASELSEAGERKGPWWGWSEGKLAMEYLFMVGRVTTHSRRGFERIYDLPERVHPTHVLEAPTPDPQEAVRELARRALCAMGVATSADIADYYRLPPERMKQAMSELVEMGAALPASVPGWKNAAYLDPNARMPRRVNAAALLSPFDPLVWRRERVERLFGFDYRIEIYVPQEKRKFGYYVLPFLLNDALVARVDLKADRAASALLVQASHLEPGADEADVAPALAEELRTMRDWLGLEEIKVMRKGDLAKALARALA
ncbi:MAG: winged helix-turn-helix domain-containing protein [Hyphomonadaceae bacterium]